MGDCDGCPDYQRRIEVYSNSNLGCPADEFVIPVIEPEPEEEPEEPEDNVPEETEDTPTPTPAPTDEDSSSMYIKGTKALLSTLAVFMLEFWLISYSLENFVEGLPGDNG